MDSSSMPGRAGRRRRRAQAVVEFALILPTFLLITAGVIEFGRAFFSYQRLLLAAQEGVRYGAVLSYAKDDPTMIARVRQVSPGGTADSVTISSTLSPQDNTPVLPELRQRGNVLTVDAQHSHTVLVPVFPLPSLTLRATSSMVIEVTPP